MTTVWARTALTAEGWQGGTRVDIGGDGRISHVEPGEPDGDMTVGVLLPAPANLHSHAFQRAMAGLTEARGPASERGAIRDSFWTWRTLMYRFLDRLTPDDFEAIAAQVQMEMLEAGYASVGEFHYVHHQPGGEAYDDPAELSARIAAAAAETGIGLTHLPVLYTRGGVDDRPLEGGQLRFGCDRDRFAELFERARAAIADLPDDATVGVAPHSLRAVAQGDLDFTTTLAPGAPLHIHIAEQTAEVEAVEAALGQRPVDWLLGHNDVDERWCLIHATHMTPDETVGLARSGAVAGLCPITESNLGDGIFEGVRFHHAGGRFGIGSDSNVRIALAEELRTLEYSQRLDNRVRAALAEAERSTGRTLFETACRGGAQALGRDAGIIAPGKLADLIALDDAALPLAGLAGDTLLDAWIFAADDRLVTDVWSAGRHVVRSGRHVRRDDVERRFRDTVTRLRADL